MSELTNVWKEIERLHADGLSLIPVRDKDEADKIAKTPYSGWKASQTARMPIAELWRQMDHNDTAAVAIIAGEISGNLEVIDVDVKFLPGIDGTLFGDLNALYPDLFKRLRIHRSPSGGFHILYRVIGGAVAGNRKLASRHATEEELAAFPKRKSYCFIETRGEGGYVLAPPSMGYTVHQDSPIPDITPEEQAAIIALATGYNQFIQIVKPYQPTKVDQSYYDSNPFEDFNNSAEACNVLTDHGWKYYTQRGKYLHYTRPGKDKGTSATFNTETRIFYNFTASAEFEENKGYQPATALSILAHNGDRKETYRYLVNKGFGKMKPGIESSMVKKAAITGRPLAPNVSEAGKTLHTAISAQLQHDHPFGIFWTIEDEGEVKIDREGFYQVAAGLGYRLLNDDLYQIERPLIIRRNERQFQDTLKEYVHEQDPDLYTKICNSYEAFIERHGKFSISRLPIIGSEELMSDTSKECFKFYQNGFVRITAAGVELKPMEEATGLILADRIQPRSFAAGKPGGKYMEFLRLAVGVTHDMEMAVGFLAHEFKDETTGYIIVLTEQCADPKDGGGAGKNIFGKLLENITTYTSKPGEQVSFDERFLQSWNGQRVFCISDAPKHFNFLFLKDLSTGDGLSKKLFKNEAIIPCAEMPKIIVNTNYSFEITDGGLKRRIIPIEFTDHFTKCGGVDVHFGCHFPKGWTEEDWSGFDNFLHGAVQKWLAGGLKLTASILTVGGWQKQFEQTYGHVITAIITEHFDAWCAKGFVPNEAFKVNLESYYTENDTPQKFRPSSHKINDALAEWSKRNNIKYSFNVTQRGDNGFPTKGRVFMAADVPF